MDTGYYISKKDYNTIINYATAAYETMKCEIGGMSICYQDEDGDWIVADPVIIKQEVTGGTCDLDKDELANYYCKAAKKHAKRNFRFCWWHSHHTMGVFWSGTDIKGINEYSDGDLSFALVVNLKRENKFRISMWKPVVMHEDTTLQILESKGSSVPKKILDEVEELCNKPSYNYSSWKKDKKDDKNQSNLWDDPDTYHYNYGWNYGNPYASDRYGALAARKINEGTDHPKLIDGQFFNYCYQKVCCWIEQMAEGALTFAAYEKEVDEVNEELEKLKSPVTLVKISRSELDEDIEFADPAMWVRVENQPILDLSREKSNGVGIK
jgi:hypothetical protein